jgi:hypothetical protein
MQAGDDVATGTDVRFSSPNRE